MTRNDVADAAFAAALARLWRGRERFVVLTTRWDGGGAFLALWHAWRDDPARCGNLHVLVVDPALPSDAGRAVRTSRPGDGDELGTAVAAAWPPPTPGLHRLAFDDGAVELLLLRARLGARVRDLEAAVDVFDLGDGSGPSPWPLPAAHDEGKAPAATSAALHANTALHADHAPSADAASQGDAVGSAANPLLTDHGVARAPGDAATRTRAIRTLARLAARGAWWLAERIDAADAAALRSAGFRIEPMDHGAATTGVDAPGAPSDRPAAALFPHRAVARYDPAFRPTPVPGRPRAPTHPIRHAVIVGAGLAGCATAWALAERGWHSALLEQGAAPAGAASGNPAGLFHGTVNRVDGVHARFNRAAALQIAPQVRAAVQAHGVPGSASGLLRLDPAPGALERMHAAIAALASAGGGDVSRYLRVVDADEASRLAGLPLEHPAWFYPQGGWVDPAGLARSYLARAGNRARLQSGSRVAMLRREGDAWELLDPAGQRLACTATLILANAGDALRLIGNPAWPIESARGQLSWVTADAWPPGHVPRLPVAGSGYVLPPVDGRVIFGATSAVGDPNPGVRAADHALNLRRLEALIGVQPERLDGLGGRTGWRSTAEDRLPLVGAVPALELLNMEGGASSGAAARHGHRLDQPRFVPREPGLFVCTALGSRGITWSALCGEVLAATIAGSPVPLEADLLDAIDPARFVSRLRRRTPGG